MAGGSCPRCGAEVREEASYCIRCGERLAGEAAPPPTPRSAVEGAGGRLAPLLLGVSGAALIIAAVTLLLLYVLVWRGGKGVGDPVSLARRYMDSLQEEDVETYLSCFEEGFFSMEDNPILEGMGLGPEELVKMHFGFMDASFRGVELEVRSQEEEKATVMAVAWTLTVSYWVLEEEVDLSEDPLDFRMARKGGRWYLVEDPLPFLGGGLWGFREDGADFDAFDLEDLEELLPDDFDLEEWEEYLHEEMDLEQFFEEWRHMTEESSHESVSGVDAGGRAAVGVKVRLRACPVK